MKYDKVCKLSCINKESINSLWEFSEIFLKITTSAEGEKTPTLHHVWPLFERIKKILMNHGNSNSLVSQMKKVGLQYVEKNKKPFEMTEEHKIATFLHPYKKKLKFVSLQESLEVREIVKKRLDSLFGADFNGLLLPESVPSSSLYADILDQSTQNDGSFDEISNYISFNISNVSTK